MSDAEAVLLKEASSGSKPALSRLFELHGPGIRARIARKIPRRFGAVLTGEDIMQQSYIDAFLDVASFASDGRDSFEGWLSTIAKNNLRNAIVGLEAKKRGGDRRRITPGDAESSVVALYELLGASMSTPSRKVALSEAQSSLQKAIDVLPEDYQRVIRLYDLEQRPIEQVASALNRRAGAVFMLRARAHRALRELMGSDSKFFSDPA